MLKQEKCQEIHGLDITQNQADGRPEHEGKGSAHSYEGGFQPALADLIKRGRVKGDAAADAPPAGCAVAASRIEQTLPNSSQTATSIGLTASKASC